MATKKMTMGLIVGNRGFFPIIWPRAAGKKCCACWRPPAWMWSALTPEESKHGAVETREESRRCADLFKKNRDRIDGVIVTLPNFGEERAIADALRLADLHVPVLIQATPDDPAEDGHRVPPRQLLRQDVSLQQSAAVRHSVFHHHAAHRKPEFARVRQGSAMVCRGLPRSERLSQPAGGGDRRASHGFQYRPLQREDSRVAGHFDRDARSLRSAGPHRAYEGQ